MQMNLRKGFARIESLPDEISLLVEDETPEKYIRRFEKSDSSRYIAPA